MAAAEAVAASVGAEIDDDTEVCFICAEPIQFSALGTCSHRTCHICALRMRALYKNLACAYCKTESKEVLFTLPSAKDFDAYKPEDLCCKDAQLNIFFESEEIMEETMILLRFNCPDAHCDVACNGWPDLKIHIKEVHKQLLCDLCVKNKKVFAHEHQLFSNKELQRHYKDGDRPVDATHDDDGFKGHPECGFCRKAFFDDDDLYKHCRDKHERCHVCDQTSQGGPRSANYFRNYQELDHHFRRDHFLCPDAGCLAQKFIVFGSEIDLKAHQLEAHPEGLRGQALKNAKRIQTDFQGYQPPPNARGGRGPNRRAGEMDLPSISTSAGPPLSREQQALQRQFEYQQSLAQRGGFGYALTEPVDSTPPPVMQVQRPAQQSVRNEPLVDAFPALGGGSRITNVRGNGPPAVNKKTGAKSQAKNNVNQRARPSTPQTTAPGTLSKHTALLERVQMLTGYDDERSARFKTLVAQYRSTNITAAELIDQLWSTLNAEADSLGGIVTGCADVLDKPDKQQELLTAWHDWKVRNRVDQPLPIGAGTTGGQRVLNIKSRASRTVSTSASAWNPKGNKSAVHTNLAGVTQRLAGLQVRGNGGAPRAAWSASGSAQPSGTTTPVRGSQPAKPSSTAFPELPASAKPRISTAQFFNKGPTWGSQADIDSDAALAASLSEGGEQATVQGKGKKKQKQKQLLFNYGLQRG
ncbi:hypothetical protein BCR37DRAFT_379489 [Protomyces lactucae-debilis]|uniref:RING-type E3 ubiquitin transferase n=1 Tax=Protomyces lactucae-debilis TaxID=2754530 RepID=A0A1Y2FEV8_PROLT|nr:uncharacterized protein BCR37DRAFT_379489 [Protomyces lactucae-debilis]ORY82490.1 hypothetical protein BCR37DRAFT_379489 [Protomyces lactucae-debilis]